MTAGPVLLPAPLADAQCLAAAFFLFYLKRKGSLPGGVRLRWTVSDCIVLQQVKPNRAGQLDVAWHIAGAPTVVLPPRRCWCCTFRCCRACPGWCK